MYGNAELRLAPGHASALLFRGEWGVFVDGQDSSRWHPSSGSGVSLAMLERALLRTATGPHSRDRATFALQADFSF